MAKTFALETLTIRMADPTWAASDLHVRIQRALRELIMDGELAPGARLPATRGLSQSLGVARDTVEAAYLQLQRDGYIVRREGSGSFVSTAINTRLVGKAVKSAKKHAAKDATETAKAALSIRGAAMVSIGEASIAPVNQAFVAAIPEMRSFPVAVWDRLQRQVMREQGSDALMYGEPQGAKPLRAAIARYLNLERGANVTAEQVCIVHSTRQALFICAQVLVDAGQSICMEDPGYYWARKAFESANLQVVPIAVDQHGLRTDLLAADKSGARCVFITPSHQFPTGVTLSLERRLELIRWAHDNHGWIIEDDYDSEFHYNGAPTACVQGLDTFARTIYMGTFSKTLYPGLRISYMVLPDALVAPMVTAKSILDGHATAVAQYTLARFMEEGHFSSHVRTMRKLYAVRREAMLSAITTYLGGIVKAVMPDGGLHIPCILESGWVERDTIRYAQQAGIVLPGLSRLFMGAQKVEGWLLGFAPLTQYEITSSVKKLADVLQANRQHCYVGQNNQHDDA